MGPSTQPADVLPASLRVFLAGDPSAQDLQNDPQGPARCEVSGNGLCEIGDYARIRRHMLGLAGGMDQTCPLSGTVYAPAVLPPLTVDEPTTIDTDRASVWIAGTADPNDIIRVTGAHGRPLSLGQANLLEVFRDHDAGHLSETVSITANQDAPIGSAMRSAASWNAPVTIGSAGGTVTSPSGIGPVVPAGSLPGNTQISLTDLGPGSGLAFGPHSLVDIGPGPITFDPLATLRFPTTTLVPGTVIDLQQIDHLNQTIVPAIGVVSAAGSWSIHLRRALAGGHIVGHSGGGENSSGRPPQPAGTVSGCVG